MGFCYTWAVICASVKQMQDNPSFDELWVVLGNGFQKDLRFSIVLIFGED